MLPVCRSNCLLRGPGKFTSPAWLRYASHWPKLRRTNKHSITLIPSSQATKHQQTQHSGTESGRVTGELPKPWVLSALNDPPDWTPFCLLLLLYGASTGTLLDGIHSRVGLQVYDVAPVTVGPLHTSLLVPVLLGVFYLVLGLLTCISDNLAPGRDTDAARQRTGTQQSPYVALCFGVLAVNLYISASFFQEQIPPGQIFSILSILTAANWALFDCTKQGVALAVLCGLGAPAAELVLMALAGVWHYSQPDVAGVFVSWVPLCYAFYVPAVSNLARHLWQRCRTQQKN